MQRSMRLYLDLLEKCLTNTLANEEPNTAASPGQYVVQFTSHYIRGGAVSMLPHGRFENLSQSSATTFPATSLKPASGAVAHASSCARC